MASTIDQGTEEWVVIDDFTPGIIQFDRGITPSSPTNMVLGSAFNSWRCYAIKNVGLCPFPTYYLGTFIQVPATTAAGSWLTVSSMICLGPTFLEGGGPVTYAPVTGPDQLIIVSSSYNAAGPTVTYQMIRAICDTAPFSRAVSIYSHSTGVPGLAGYAWPNIAVGIFNGTGGQQPFVKCAFWIDPSQAAATAVTIAPDPASLNDSRNASVPTSGYFPVIPAVNTAYATSRALYMYNLGSAQTVDHFSNYGTSAVYPTDAELFTTSTTTAQYFVPELGATIGSWGSISTGEFFIVYNQTGAAVISGDVAFASSVTKLAGVAGTGLACGPGVESPLGLIYVTDTDGVYVWNGGNVAEKISQNVPDTAFVRSNFSSLLNGPIIGINNGVNGFPGLCNHQNDMFGYWCMFANNWVYDTIYSGWWQCENPAVQLFDIHCQGSSPRFAYSAPTTVAQNPAGGSALFLGIFRWDRTLGATTYMWQSNPLAEASPGRLLRLAEVQLTVTNGALPATIVVTPVPSGDPSATSTTIVGGTFATGVNRHNDVYVTPPQNAVLFNIPANVTNYRVRQRMGWVDSQIAVRLDVANQESRVFPVVSAPVIQNVAVAIAETSMVGR